MLIGALGCAAILWGSWQALQAQRLKLLAAYSTVAQLGYLFLFFPLLLAYRAVIILLQRHEDRPFDWLTFAIRALGLVKWAAATANRDLGKLGGSGKKRLSDDQIEALRQLPERKETTN